MAYYFAWSNDGETFAESTHAVEDEDIFSFELTQQEGGFAQLSVEVRNPRIGLLNPGRQQWVWFSEDDGSGVVPLFYGRLVGMPADLQGEIIALVFQAKPTNFDAQKAALAQTMRVLPFYDPVFTPPEQRTNPDFVLEGYTKLFNVDRVTHVVTASDIILGEDGLYDFGDRAFYDGVSLTFGQRPATVVHVTARFQWTQGSAGEIDLTDAIYNAFVAASSTRDGCIATYTGGGLFASWPENATSIGAGWTFGTSYCTRVDGSRIPALNLMVDIESGGFAGADNAGGALTSLQPTTIIVEGPFDEEHGWVPSGEQFTSSWPAWFGPLGGTNNLNDDPDDIGFPSVAGFPEWGLVGVVTVSYEAARDRVEVATFDVTAGVQAITTSNEDSALDINLTTAEVDNPVDGNATIAVPSIDYPAIWESRALTWSIIDNPALLMPDGLRTAIVRAFGIWSIENGFSFQQLPDNSTRAQIVLSWEPVSPGIFGVTTDIVAPDDGRFVREGVAFNSAETWTNELYQSVTLHEIGHALGLQHSADPTSIMYPTTTLLYPSVADVELVRTLYGGTLPIGDRRRDSYLLTDRGFSSIEHLVCRARARLLSRARAARLSLDVPYDEAKGLSCRWSAMVSDPRLPGTTVSGKIVVYSLSLNGDTGERAATVTLGCTIGRGETLTPSVGVPGWVDEGWVEPGWQAYSGGAIPLADNDIQIFDYSGTLIDDDGVDLFNLNAANVIASLAVVNGAAAQAALLLGGTWADTNAAITALNENMTEVAMALVPMVTHEPFTTNFPITVSELAVPKTIDLEADEAGAST